MIRPSAALWLWPLILGACADFKDEGFPTPRPLGAEIPTFRPPLDSPAATQPLRPDPTGPLTLRQALALALWNHPELASLSWSVRMAEARRVQAGLPPNPEIAFDLETLGALRTAERTLQLGQVIFLSGKLERQVQLAALQRDLAGWDYEAKRIGVYTATTKAFVAVRAAQENLTLTEQIWAMTEQMADVARQRVSSGKAAPIEAMKARVELGQISLDRQKAREELAGARQRLALMWGSHEPKFTQADAPFVLGPPAPPPHKLSALLTQHPHVARWATEMAQRQAVSRLEKAKAFPDPTLGGGWKHAEGRDGWTAGVSIPLPLLDRNQGGIREADYGVAQGREDRRAAWDQACRDLSEAYQLLATAQSQGAILETQILPEAQKVLDVAAAGYRQGKLSYLEVLDAQRTCFNARLQWVQTLADYYAALAQVEGLIGQSLSSIDTINSATSGGQ